MKQALVTAYVFTAAAKTVDLSSIVSFDVKRLYAIINITANQVIYAVGIPAYGLSSITGSVLTLNFDTTAMSNTDKLAVIYDTVNTDIANAFVTKNTDGTNSQTYTASGEAKVLVTPLTNSSIVKAQLQDNSGSAITLGQKVSASSLPMVIASDQSPLPVTQSGTWTTGRTWTLSSGTDSVASVQSGTWTARIQDSSGSALTSTGGALNVNVSGGSIDIGTADKTTFTYGTSVQQTIGGVFQDTSPTLTAGQSGAIRSTAQRGLHVNLRDSSGNEKLGQLSSAASIPVVIASDQSPVPASQSGTWNINNVSGTVSLPTNAAQEAGGHLASIDTKLGTGPAAQDSTLSETHGSAAGGTAAAKSELVGGQFNSAAPSLTNGQQAAIQLDSSARQIIAPLTNASIVKSQLQDNSGAAVTLGQKASTSSLPVVLASDQSAIPVTQSGTWTVGRTWTLSSGSDSVLAVQSGNWDIRNITGTVPLPTNAAQETGGHLASIDSKLNSFGQKTMANSMPVAIASDQSSIPVTQSGTWTNRIQDSSGSALSSTGGALNVNISSGSIDVGTADKSAFTYGTSIQQPIGAVFQDTSPTLTAGQTGALRSTAQRGLHVNLRDSSGNEKLGSSTSANSIPVVIASDQASVPVAATQSGTWNINNLSGTVSLPTNAAQETGGHLASIDTKLGTGPVAQDSTVANIQGSATGGTAATKSSLSGGIFNTALPTLTNGQQASLQFDSSGRLIIAPLTNSSIVKAQLQDNSGSAITLGQKTMANSVPVVLSSDQAAIPVSQSGTWTTARSWTLASGTDSVSAVQGTAAALAGKWPVQVTDGTNTMPTMDTAGRAGFHKITDGTNTAAVKAASTAPAAADPSLVVAMSPNVAGTTAVSAVQYMNTANPSEGTTGSAVPARSMQVAGSDGTNLRTLNTDASGNLYCNPAATSFKNITTATTTTVKSGAGKLIAINVNTGVASATITVYDNTAGSGTKIGVITLQGGGAGIQAFALDYKYLPFATGLTLVTSGATDVTVIYQ